MCAGVNAAIAKALTLKNVWCLHELVHNEIVTAELKALDFRFVEDVDEVPPGETVVFSAHGVSPQVRARAKARGLKVVDTTCPFVAKVHEAVRAFAAKGLPVVVIGNPDHVEVKGVVGEVAPDGAIVVLQPGRGNAESVFADLPEGAKVGVVSQTSMNADEVGKIAVALKRRFEVETMPRVCTATRERQQAVRSFRGDALLVLGSRQSSNTKRLCEVAPCPAYLAGTLDEVRALKAELLQFDTVGVTSGASTPESFFNAAVGCLAEGEGGDVE